MPSAEELGLIKHLLGAGPCNKHSQDTRTRLPLAREGKQLILGLRAGQEGSLGTQGIACSLLLPVAIW